MSEHENKNHKHEEIGKLLENSHLSIACVKKSKCDSIWNKKKERQHEKNESSIWFLVHILDSHVKHRFSFSL